MRTYKTYGDALIKRNRKPFPRRGRFKERRQGKEAEPLTTAISEQGGVERPRLTIIYPEE